MNLVLRLIESNEQVYRSNDFWFQMPQTVRARSSLISGHLIWDLTTLNRDGARHGDEGREVEAPARGSTCTGGRPIDPGVSAVEEQSAVGAATSEQQPEWWNPDVGQHIQESSRWRSSAKDSRPGADSSWCPELCFGLVLEPPELLSSFSHCIAIKISSFQLWSDRKAHA